jgi:hypothetical protein
MPRYEAGAFACGPGPTRGGSRQVGVDRRVSATGWRPAVMAGRGWRPAIVAAFRAAVKAHLAAWRSSSGDFRIRWLRGAAARCRARGGVPR